MFYFYFTSPFIYSFTFTEEVRSLRNEVNKLREVPSIPSSLMRSIRIL